MPNVEDFRTRDEIEIQKQYDLLMDLLVSVRPEVYEMVSENIHLVTDWRDNCHLPTCQIYDVFEKQGAVPMLADLAFRKIFQQHDRAFSVPNVRVGGEATEVSD